MDTKRFGLDETLGLGTLDINRGRAALDAELGRGNLALDQELGRGNLDVSRGNLALSGRKVDLDQELGRGDQALAYSADAEKKRQFDTDVGIKSEARDYDRAKAQRLAQVRSKFVNGLAAGQTLKSQGVAS